MALKAHRNVVAEDLSFFNNDTTAQRGGICVLSTAGSGAAMDQSVAVVTYAADPSGKVPVGLLVQDIVNLDLTRQHINWHKDEVQTGQKVTLLTQGWVVTNWIYPGTTPTAGAKAYVGQSGYITPTFVDDNRSPMVGRFLSTKDEDGYAKVAINLPMASVTTGAV